MTDVKDVLARLRQTVCAAEDCPSSSISSALEHLPPTDLIAADMESLAQPTGPLQSFSYKHLHSPIPQEKFDRAVDAAAYLSNVKAIHLP